MSDKIRRVTPREIAEMMIGEQAYQSTLFVTAADHDAEIERLRKRVAVSSRVAVLEEALRSAISVGWEVVARTGRVDQHMEKLRAARAVLEAKP